METLWILESDRWKRLFPEAIIKAVNFVLPHMTETLKIEGLDIWF